VLLDVGDADSFPERGLGPVTVNGRQVVLVRWGRQWFALYDRCPHQGGPLSRGVVLPGPRAEGVGAMGAEQGEPVVSCAWHGWQFYARTGRSVWDAHCRVAAFRVEVRDGRVMLELPPSWRLARQA
jgi:nitrite reductase/ring-hydroxylating ferredoxin subunit